MLQQTVKVGAAAAYAGAGGQTCTAQHDGHALSLIVGCYFLQVMSQSLLTLKKQKRCGSR
jgi:hypothetical protein